jgi:hypothetical protein
MNNRPWTKQRNNSDGSAARLAQVQAKPARASKLALPSPLAGRKPSANLNAPPGCPTLKLSQAANETQIKKKQLKEQK